MRPDGAVLAMVGGRDYRKSQFNRAVDANRQPGSAFKLFVYLAALRKGYTPQDTIDAGPVDINGWEPENFDNEHYGRITLADAFAQSVNTAAVRLAMDVGMDNVIAAARDLGMTEPLADVPSLALGSVGVSLLDLTGAFASVRADRMRVQPWGIAAVGAENGSRMLATLPPLGSAQTLGPLSEAAGRALAGRGRTRHRTGGGIDGFAAGKTGTSQDYRDAWFIGFNESLVVGVWVGNDDDSPMRRRHRRRLAGVDLEAVHDRGDAAARTGGASRSPRRQKPKRCSPMMLRRSEGLPSPAPATIRPVRGPTIRSARPTAPTNPIAAGRAKSAKRAISDRTRRNRLPEQRPTSEPPRVATPICALGATRPFVLRTAPTSRSAAGRANSARNRSHECASASTGA